MQTCTAHAFARPAALILLAAACAAHAESLRMVSYNIAADINGVTQAPPELITVLQGIGDESTYAPARPVDVLTLQETTSNTQTVDPILTGLNNVYGPGAYARSTYQGTQFGSPTVGNGPNALIYRTGTVQLIPQPNGFDGIGVPRPSTVPREPTRYQFRPVGGVPENDFYVYVSHYKAGNTSEDRSRRNDEALAIRADAAALPADARIVYTGDLNLYTSSEAAYQTLLAAGQGQAFDPFNLSNQSQSWNNNSTYRAMMTFSSIDLHARFDFQLMSGNVINDFSGLHYTEGTYHTFMVNGSVPLDGSVNSPENNASPTLPNRAAVLNALTTASDHLPVIADFTIVVTGPPTIALEPTSFERTVRRGVNPSNDTFTVANTGQSILTYTITPGAIWLGVTPGNGTSTGEADPISVIYSTAALPVGDYASSISVSDPIATISPQFVAVTVHILPANGDFDMDNDTDMSDFGHLQDCLRDELVGPACTDADFNADGLVNPLDTAAFLNCLSGPDMPPAC